MEPLILYLVLFFPVGAAPAGVIPFSMLRELGRTISYTIPSLALIWYLIPEKKGFSALKEEKFHKRDIFPLVTGLPALIIIGLFVSFLASFFSGYPDLAVPSKVEAPAAVSGWIVMFFSCLGTGYLEESYFRYYLLTRLEASVPGAVLRIFISTVLFSLCHAYEGPWGIVNALLAGIILSVLFLRFRSLHGIALAHGGYNIFVYVMGIFIV